MMGDGRGGGGRGLKENIQNNLMHLLVFVAKNAFQAVLFLMQ